MIKPGTLAKLVHNKSAYRACAALTCRPVYRHNNSWWYSDEDFMTGSEGDIVLVLECSECSWSPTWTACLWNERYVFIQTVDLQEIST